ncbi:host attachment family protein [Dokdonella sp.]|uniref:host attachment family protein n=1 Tax=Dokdonella sp. TaxID=2291710 RepID=UPI00352799F1
MQKIPAGAWVVVTDGAGARLFHNMGKGATVSLKQQELLEPDDLIDDGPSGKRPAEESDQAKDEATFAKQLAHRLNAAALKQEFTDLILMADPQTLGQLRPQLHNETTRRIIKEVAKTFTNAPVEDIESALNH